MGNHWDQQSYYEILEVSPDAHESEIRIAYHRAKNTYSQDNPALLSVFTKEETAELVKLLEEAYAILSNPATRSAYNQRLGRERGGKTELHSAEHFLKQALNGDEEESSFPEFTYEEEPTLSATPPPAPPPEERFSSQGRTAVSSYKIESEVEETIKNEDNFSGEFLKFVREYKNIDLDQISEHTRIGKDYLRAVEAETFDKLPAPVFVRGFLVQLARLYGLQADLLCKKYLERLKAHKK